MRITVDLPEDLVGLARRRADRDATTLDVVLADALWSQLRSSSMARLRPLPVSTADGGLQPWIDPSSNASFLDEADDPTRD